LITFNIFIRDIDLVGRFPSQNLMANAAIVVEADTTGSVLSWYTW